MQTNINRSTPVLTGPNQYELILTDTTQSKPMLTDILTDPNYLMEN